MIIHVLGSKVNFVDANNVLVGFDTGQSCCETAQWAITGSLDIGAEPAMWDATEIDLTDYVFDPVFVAGPRESEHYGGDGGGTIAFRLTAVLHPGASPKPDLYLHLTNDHNGYYSHGFSIEVGGQTIWGGSL